MKTNNRFTGLSMITMLAVLILVSSSHSPKDHEAVTNGINLQDTLVVLSDSLPAEVQEVIESSCINCHAAGGRALAMTKLNFSVWNEYDSEKKMKKAEKMCEELTKGSMPPKSFIRDHPELTPTAEQVDIICKWAEGLKDM